MADPLSGKHVLVTSGPTRAPLDAVRYLSNRSTGRLGRRIATEMLRRGAEVTLVSGPDAALPDREELTEGEIGRLRVVPVETVPDLLDALERSLAGPGPPGAVVHAMAVLDYVPETPEPEKMPSSRREWSIRLVRAPKVVKRIRQWMPEGCLIQFKLEVRASEEELRRRAMESLRANRADYVVANDLSRIRDEAHPALILDAEGRVLGRPGTKGEIADALCDLLAVV
ncbi:MAG: phosphopantothenoylcysteine decarboxylase [Candidatus Brocadiaceae bacterium]|jgi:phosphopantothenoylcysteine synthetase/decarboxylase